MGLMKRSHVASDLASSKGSFQVTLVTCDFSFYVTLEPMVRGNASPLNGVRSETQIVNRGNQ